MSLRILHCPNNVAGNPGMIARSERELGLNSKSIAYRPHRFGYQADKYLVNTIKRTLTSQLTLELKKFQLLRWAMRDYEITHFNSGQSIFAPIIRGHTTERSLYTRLFYQIYRPYQWLLFMKDIELLHQAGKGICVTFQGSDARQGDHNLAHFEFCIAREVDDLYYFPGTDDLRRKVIAKFGHYADRIYYLNPDLGHVLPERAEYLPYAQIDIRDWQPVTTSNKKPVVVHAPSHRGTKGTHYVLSAIERLQKDDIDFEFLLIENMRHDTARKLYARADLLVDNLVGGWYGGLAVELMALGKPVLCHLREGDLHFIPGEMRAELPMITATPLTIYTVLKEWLTTRRSELPALGQRSRAFVEKWHDPLKIAARLKSDYEAIMAAKSYR